MRLALLFSGQGGQRPEHWQQVRERAPVAWRPLLHQLLPELMADDAAVEPEKLAENRLAQPLIFAQQMMLWAALRDKLPRPICAVGYSLGEMAAGCAAGAFSPTHGLALCGERARLMDQAAPGASGMLAVLGLDDVLVSALAGELGLAVAIRNAPRHLVLAGPQPAIEAAEARFSAAGASRLVRLAVHTPSHTACLAAAADAFARQLAALPDGRLVFPVFSAIDARPARTARQALTALARQLCTPLDWASCQQTVLEMQPDAVLEIGPGNALARLFGELAPAIPVRACDDFRSVDGILAWLGACGR
jgi:[acyl-carrier-protein] S-malonyltransferase